MPEARSREQLEHLLEFHYPRFGELPNELVFLDEVVRLINDAHKPIPASMRRSKKLFTTSMASNYIKQKLTPPPIGRKYGRDHICLMCFAATMKLSFSADNVLALAHRLFDGQDMATVNDGIGATLERKLAAYARAGLKALDAQTDGHAARRRSDPRRELSSDTMALIEFVTDTFAAKAAALALVGRDVDLA